MSDHMAVTAVVVVAILAICTMGNAEVSVATPSLEDIVAGGKVHNPAHWLLIDGENCAVPDAAVAPVGYDFVWDVHSVAGLFSGRSWNLYFPNTTSQNSLTSDESWRLVVSIVSLSAQGSGWILHRLGGKTPPRTGGGSVGIQGIIAPDALWMKATSARDPVRYDAAVLHDRRATDVFLRELMFEVADVTFFVLDRLTLDDQLHLFSYCYRLKQKMEDLDIRKRLRVIHNFRDIDTEQEAEEAVSKDIVKHFNATEIKTGGHKYFASELMTHYVLLNDDAPEGKPWNEKTFALITNEVTASIKNVKLNAVIGKLTDTASELLPRFAAADPLAPTERPRFRLVPGELVQPKQSRSNIASDCGAEDGLMSESSSACATSDATSVGAQAPCRLSLRFPFVPHTIDSSKHLQLSSYLDFSSGIVSLRRDHYKPTVRTAATAVGFRVEIYASSLSKCECRGRNVGENAVLSVSGTRQPMTSTDERKVLGSTVQEESFDLVVQGERVVKVNSIGSFHNSCKTDAAGLRDVKLDSTLPWQ